MYNCFTWLPCGNPNLFCRRLLDSVEISSTVRSFLSCRAFRHRGPPLLRKSYIFVQRRRLLPPIWSSLCISIFQTSFFKWLMTDAHIKRKSIYKYYLLLVDAIKYMLDTCQKKVHYHWFSCDSWRPRGARHVWGRSVKCPGLIAGVSFARLSPSLCFLFYALPPSFVPFPYFLETPATQANLVPVETPWFFLLFLGRNRTGLIGRNNRP